MVASMAASIILLRRSPDMRPVSRVLSVLAVLLALAALGSSVRDARRVMAKHAQPADAP